MSAQPIQPENTPTSESSAVPYEVIHLGGQSAVVVPMADFLRLRALEQAANESALEDAEDSAAFQDWEAREAAGTTSYASMSEVRQQLGLQK